MIILYRLAYWITRSVPVRMAYALAVFTADCKYAFSKADRRAVEANLKVILNTKHVPAAMAREVFHNFGRYLAEFFVMTKYVDKDFIRDHVEIVNLEYINEVLKHGKGAVMVSAHWGNWEMAGALLSSLGYPLSVVALPHKDPRVNKFFNDQREYFGTTVIPTTTAVRRCVEHLKANRLVALLGERDFSQRGMVMDFLGRPTLIPKGAAVFSLRTGAPIVPSFFTRKDNGDFYAAFGKPIYPSLVANGKATDEELAAMIRPYLHIIEERIRRYPTQWLMFREFWAP